MLQKMVIGRNSTNNNILDFSEPNTYVKHLCYRYQAIEELRINTYLKGVNQKTFGI